jgi:adenylate cyclase
MTTEQRRLAAIVSADVAGYSRLMGKDESGTLAALKALRQEVVDPAIATHGGRIVKTTGDGLLLEFPSVVNAVRCAVEVQTAMADRTAGIAEDRRIAFRIGINIGDIIVDGDDIFGDGVNVAARLQEMAAPGGICVSSRVHEDVRDRLDTAFDDGGTQALKNIARPIQVWRWQPGTAVPPNAAAAPIELPLPDKPSIAVLPFTNMIGDPEQEYFVDGLAEDIITELTRFRSLFVIARNSSFSYKSKSPHIRDVGRELGVRYVLEGSVRRAGNRIRLTGQLVDTHSGSHIWAERYDRQLDDVFTVQEELTRSIVRAVAPQISDAELARVRRRRPESLNAYEIAVRANATAQDAFVRSDQAMCQEALRLAQEALAIDPDSGIALGARAMAQCQHLWRGTAVDREAAWWDGMEAAERLLDLDRSSGIAHVWKAHLLVLSPDGGRFDEALTNARQGHDLNPHDMTSLTSLAFIENMAENPERSIELLQEALRVSPRDPLRPQLLQQLAMATWAAKRYSEAVEHARAGIAEAPGIPPLHAFLAASYVGLGQYDQAKSAMADARRTGPEYVESQLNGTNLQARDPKRRARFVTFLRVAAGLEDPSAAEALR